jgi:hypothetical protein
MLAIALCGPATPLDRLAIVAGVSKPGTLIDSARKQGRRVCERLQARGLVVQRHVRGRYAECTHVSTPGHKGRDECVALRRKLGITSGCAAHHGHDVRELVEGFTQGEVARRLAISASEITRRVKAKRERDRALRREDGRPANDVEARDWRGQPTTRGPRGTNHTSPRRTNFVPPIPPEGLKGLETSASPDRERGDKRPPELAPKALAGGFAPTAQVDGVSSDRESTPRTTAAAARLESTEGGRARRVPEGAAVVSISKARETRAIVNWFRGTWAARGLPTLSRLDLLTLWCRAQQLPREDLALAIGRAVRPRWSSRSSRERVFVRIFADRGVLAELVHEERRDREIAEAGGRGGAPARPSFATRSGENAHGPLSGGGAGAASGGEPPREPPALPPRRKLGPPALLSPEEFARRRAEQVEIALALDAGELLEIPIVGDVK